MLQNSSTCSQESSVKCSGGVCAGVRGGTLVVCPASLVQQWAGEVRAHCAPHALAVALHHGAARASQPHRLAASDLVITTYHILQRETEVRPLSIATTANTQLQVIHIELTQKTN